MPTLTPPLLLRLLHLSPGQRQINLACVNGAESIERGKTNRAHTHTVWESTFIPHYIEIAPTPHPLPLSPPLAFSLPLSGELRDGDLFKGHLNHLSYLRVSSLRWQAQQRNFASGSGFVHFITSQRGPERHGFSCAIKSYFRLLLNYDALNMAPSIFFF